MERAATTATATITAGSILVLDLGKYMSAACAHYVRPDRVRLRPLATDHDYFRRPCAKYRPVALVIAARALVGRRRRSPASRSANGGRPLPEDPRDVQYPSCRVACSRRAAPGFASG
jgi:hypothetical protein